ncbi:hypothetical protein VC188_09635 [Polynucleobacter sp. MG-28-Ekke-A2]|uniref:hypothetical protein n=1 Tax=Polynucleobacter sp. MG-28-Ekke-A2 TaxID=3108276 RepID=UPI002B22FA2F|nr:hypothetical protein [Polynucleobacter sp. MG-28-Ekke-A2]MEA9602378.1 hypothetical protein [Polynucleobacter sp. MG-28-Ekke-A2]
MRHLNQITFTAMCLIAQSAIASGNADAIFYGGDIVTMNKAQTLSAINVPNAYRIQISRRVQWMIHQAQSLGGELQPKNPSAFLTKKSTESIGDQLGLFDS